jgi:hypothetical protein
MDSPTKRGVFDDLVDKRVFIDRGIFGASSSELPIFRSLTKVNNIRPDRCMGGWQPGFGS